MRLSKCLDECMAINQYIRLQIASGTSEGVPSPPIKMLLSSAFGAELIKPSRSASDSGVVDMSCWTQRSSYPRFCQHWWHWAAAAAKFCLVCLNKFLCILLGGSDCFMQISKGFWVNFLQAHHEIQQFSQPAADSHSWKLCCFSCSWTVQRSLTTIARFYILSCHSDEGSLCVSTCVFFSPSGSQSAGHSKNASNLLSCVISFLMSSTSHFLSVGGLLEWTSLIILTLPCHLLGWMPGIWYLVRCGLILIPRWYRT